MANMTLMKIDVISRFSPKGFYYTQLLMRVILLVRYFFPLKMV